MQPWLLPIILTFLLEGCGGIGPSVLGRDLLDYAKAMSDSQKRQTLFNVVRLRYGDGPVFLSTSQLISGYTVQGTAQASVNTFPSAPASSFFGAQGAVGYIDHPTFTFTPVTGDQYAESYIRPLSPVQLLPLAQSGLPIDVLLRLGVQAIGDLQNSNPLNGPTRAGSPDFFRLLADLRTLQVASALSLRFQKETNSVRVFFHLSESADPDLRRVAAETRRLLGIDPDAREFEVMYGYGHLDHNRVTVLTRSILAMLAAVGSEIEVPEEDIRAGLTLETVHPVVPTMRPVITIHSGSAQPPVSFVSLKYQDRWFWVDNADFKSKAALTVLEVLHSIAESSHTPQAPLITIPVG
jgi:hypothetical protein